MNSDSSLPARAHSVASIQAAIRQRGRQIAGKSLPDPSLSPLESRVAAIWGHHLNAGISLTSNFYNLGGSSLLAVRILADIERTMRVRVPLVTLLRTGGFRAFCDELHDLAAKQGSRQHDGPLTAVPAMIRLAPFLRGARITMPHCLRTSEVHVFDVALSRSVDPEDLVPIMKAIQKSHLLLACVVRSLDDEPYVVLCPEGVRDRVKKIGPESAGFNEDLDLRVGVCDASIRPGSAGSIVRVRLAQLFFDVESIPILRHAIEDSLEGSVAPTSKNAFLRMIADPATYFVPEEVTTYWREKAARPANRIVELGRTPRGKVFSKQGGRVVLDLAAPCAAFAACIARKRQTSLSNVLLAAIFLMVRAETDLQTLIIALRSSARTAREFDGELGRFDRSLYIGISPEGQTLEELTDVVRREMLEALANQPVLDEAIWRDVPPRPSAAYGSRVSLAYIHNDDKHRPEPADGIVSGSEDATFISHFDATTRSIRIGLKFSASVMDSRRAHELLEKVARLLEPPTGALSELNN